MSDNPAPATPWHLWVIGVFALLWNAFGSLDFVMTEMQNEAWMAPFSPEELDFFYGVPLWTVVAWGVGVFGGVLGSLLMLMRMKLATWVYALSFVAMLVVKFQNYVLSNGFEVMGGTGAMVVNAMVAGIAVLLLGYAWRMERVGVLR